MPVRDGDPQAPYDAATRVRACGQHARMRPPLSHLASSQGGLFTRSQALAAGYSSREIISRTRPGGDWVTVLRGCFAPRAWVDSLDATDRWVLKDRAAAMRSLRPAVLSHDSGARVLGIATLDVAAPRSHLTHPGAGSSTTRGGVMHHHDQLPLCLEAVDGLVTTSYARTALDIGRQHGFTHGLVALDSVRNMGVPRSDLEAEVARMEHHPHIARAKAALDKSDPGAESPLETLGRMLVEELGIGEVETQFAVRIAGGRVVWCDLRVRRHVFECHGRVKILGPEAGGVAREPAAEVLWKQKKRQTDVCAEGLGMSDIYWDDIFGVARARARQRLLKEYAVTESRFGTELPEHLRRFADAHPRWPASGSRGRPRRPPKATLGSQPTSGGNGALSGRIFHA